MWQLAYVAEMFCKLIVAAFVAETFCKSIVAALVAEMFCKLTVAAFVTEMFCKLIVAAFLAEMFFFRHKCSHNQLTEINCRERSTDIVSTPNCHNCTQLKLSTSQRLDPKLPQATQLTVSSVQIIIMYIYHALTNDLSAHTTHVNLKMIFYTHVEHSPTKTIYIKY